MDENQTLQIKILIAPAIHQDENIRMRKRAETAQPTASATR
jgi:hypothetical protein